MFRILWDTDLDNDGVIAHIATFFFHSSPLLFLLVTTSFVAFTCEVNRGGKKSQDESSTNHLFFGFGYMCWLLGGLTVWVVFFWTWMCLFAPAFKSTYYDQCGYSYLIFFGSEKRLLYWLVFGRQDIVR